MTIKKTNQKATKQCLEKKIDQASQKIEELLLSVLKKNKVFLYTYPETQLTETQTRKFQKKLDRLLNNEPIAYILKFQPFLNLKLKVNKEVLIPRPETEQLVKRILEDISKKPSQRNSTIADIGTGSGAIILGLAFALKQDSFRFIATDIKKSILKVAKDNAKQLKLKSKIDFRKGHLLTPLKKKKVNILVANLPYLSPEQIASSPDRTLLPHEPQKALTDNQDGLTLIKELLRQSPQYLLPKARVYLEIGHNQGLTLKKWIAKHLPRTKTTIIQDNCGFDRILMIRF